VSFLCTSYIFRGAFHLLIRLGINYIKKNHEYTKSQEKVVNICDLLLYYCLYFLIRLGINYQKKKKLLIYQKSQEKVVSICDLLLYYCLCFQTTSPQQKGKEEMKIPVYLISVVLSCLCNYNLETLVFSNKMKRKRKRGVQFKDIDSLNKWKISGCLAKIEWIWVENLFSFNPFESALPWQNFLGVQKIFL
jgi:hypothetical protein